IIPIGISGPDTDPLVIVVAMTTTVVISGGLAWRSLRSPRPSWGTGATFVILGGLAGYAWPLSFLFVLPVPDAVTGWTFGPALPVWQGLMTMVIGVAMILQRAMSAPAPSPLHPQTAPETAGSADADVASG